MIRLSDRYEPSVHGNIIALDGHDGSGKTTLTHTLVSHLKKKYGAQYVRPYAPPFGDALIRAADVGDTVQVLAIAQDAINAALQSVDTSQVMVFDRCWVTVFTLLAPNEQTQWVWRPPSVIIWADLATTLSRLSERDEAQESHVWHQTYIDAYESLALRYGLPLIDTAQLAEAQATAAALNLIHSRSWCAQHSV